jgi:hypothetical protein
MIEQKVTERTEMKTDRGKSLVYFLATKFLTAEEILL